MNEILKKYSGVTLFLALSLYYAPTVGSRMSSKVVNALVRSIPLGSHILDTAETFRDYVLNLDDNNLKDIYGIGEMGTELVHTIQEDLQDESKIKEILNLICDENIFND